MGEEERVGMAAGHAFRRLVSCGDQRGEILCPERAAGLCVAHHALRHALGFDARRGGQSLNYLQLGDADAQGASRQLEKWQALVLRQNADPLPQALEPLWIIQALQRQQALVHPGVERYVFPSLGRRQQQRQRLREVADALITFLDQPLRQARLEEREFTQQLGRNHLTRLAAREEIDCPCRARLEARICDGGAQIVLERLVLVIGRSGRVEPSI